MDIGDKLKQIIKAKKLSANQVAVKLDIDRGYLSKVLNNKINPSCGWLKKVLDCLGYTIVFKKKGGDKKRKKKK